MADSELDPLTDQPLLPEDLNFFINEVVYQLTEDVPLDEVELVLLSLLFQKSLRFGSGMFLSAFECFLISETFLSQKVPINRRYFQIILNNCHVFVCRSCLDFGEA